MAIVRQIQEKELCKSTDLKHWIITEICWNKNWVFLLSL